MVIEHFNINIIEQLAIALADLHSIKLNGYGKPLTESKKGTRMDYLHDGTETLRKLAAFVVGQPSVIAQINQLLNKMEKMAQEKKQYLFS